MENTTEVEEEILVRKRRGDRQSRGEQQSQQQSTTQRQSKVEQQSQGGQQPQEMSLSRRNSAAQGTGRNFKRLIVCCDGTWLDSSSVPSKADSWYSSIRSNNNKTQDPSRITEPSNVTRLTRAIKAQSADGIQQIVYYQAGVGSAGSVGDKIIGGISGQGLSEHVREAYSFIANNYEDGDEIFLIGFSRGAYTARSIGGLIGGIGVMTKAGLADFPIVYQDFIHRHDRNYKSPYPNIPFSRKPGARDPEYAREMARRRLTTLGVHIKAIAVFDTVGSLGVPKLPQNAFLRKLGDAFGDPEEYQFYDTSLDNCVDNAFQALALDEKRSAFGPTLWEKRGDNRTNLIQVWFPGVHSNIGGGYDDQELANITLAWMMSMLSPLLDLSLNYILSEDKANAAYYEDQGQSPRAWSFGKIYDSASGIYAAGGTTIRTPGNYYRTNPKSGEKTDRLLKDTNEYIHASVRSRFNLRGPGYADKGDYDPPALRDFKLSTAKRVANLPTPWFWEQQVDDRIVLPEAPLRSVEKMLLHMTPEVEDLILGEPPPSKRSSKRDSNVQN